MTKNDSILRQDINKRPTRSWLFTPATRPERFAKAKEAGADVQIIDLEDSVPPAEKESARRNAFDYLAKRNAGPLEYPMGSRGSGGFGAARGPTRVCHYPEGRITS
jgi:hypothetical protein